jgi:hypothetical protein
MEFVMGDLAQVEIERDVADAAAQRAAEQGLTVTAYISLLLRRSLNVFPVKEACLSTITSTIAENSISNVSRTRATRVTNAAPALYDTIFSRG